MVNKLLSRLVNRLSSLVSTNHSTSELPSGIYIMSNGEPYILSDGSYWYL